MDLQCRALDCLPCRIVFLIRWAMANGTVTTRGNTRRNCMDDDDDDDDDVHTHFSGHIPGERSQGRGLIGKRENEIGNKCNSARWSLCCFMWPPAFALQVTWTFAITPRQRRFHRGILFTAAPQKSLSWAKALCLFSCVLVCPPLWRFLRIQQTVEDWGASPRLSRQKPACMFLSVYYKSQPMLKEMNTCAFVTTFPLMSVPDKVGENTPFLSSKLIFDENIFNFWNRNSGFSS